MLTAQAETGGDLGDAGRLGQLGEHAGHAVLDLPITTDRQDPTTGQDTVEDLLRQGDARFGIEQDLLIIRLRQSPFEPPRQARRLGERPDRAVPSLGHADHLVGGTAGDIDVEAPPDPPPRPAIDEAVPIAAETEDLAGADRRQMVAGGIGDPPHAGEREDTAGIALTAIPGRRPILRSGEGFTDTFDAGRMARSIGHDEDGTALPGRHRWNIEDTDHRLPSGRSALRLITPRQEPTVPDCRVADLAIHHIIQGWETAKRDRSVTGGPLQIAGRRYDHGIGTHTVSCADIRLDGQASRFTTQVGVDDAVGQEGLGAARFLVLVDGQLRADSGICRGGEPAQELSVTLTGARSLRLLAEAPDDLTHHGHADWCDATIDYAGAPPELVAPDRGEAIPPLERDPRPRLLGGLRWLARPGRPIVYQIPCCGENLQVVCDDLPTGLTLEATTGVLRGQITTPGLYRIPLQVTNSHGSTTGLLRLEIADRAGAPLPPMGWNSWNAYGWHIDAATIQANARALVAHGLHRYGYRYCNIDDGWQGTRRADTAIPWALQANDGFADLPGLVAEIHAAGCLVGIYSVACTYSPQGLMGGSGDRPDGTSTAPFQHGRTRPIGSHTFFAEDVRQWMDWDIDFVKWDVGPPPAVFATCARTIAEGPRDLVLSYSANIPLTRLPEYRGLVQLWRTTGDLIDTWPSVRNKLYSQVRFAGQGGPDGWSDCDMLVVGVVGPGWNGEPQPSRLSWREQALHIGLWNFLASPLLIGCDLTRLDASTRDLLTRPGLIELNQDGLGAPATPVLVDRTSGRMLWTRPLENSDLALALVNLGEEDLLFTIDPADFGRGPLAGISDCWTEERVDLPQDGKLAIRLAPHDHRIYRLTWLSSLSL